MHTLLALLLLSGAARAWELSTPYPESYRFEIDRTVAHGGQGSGRLRALGVVPARHYATLDQGMDASHYLRRRVRYSAALRTQDADKAGLWLRVDPWQGEPLQFDNMERHPVRGTSDWSVYTIELEVPENAYFLHFGAWLQGRGEIWLDDVKLEKMGEALPASMARRKLRRDPPWPLEPVDPGFQGAP